MQPHFCVQFRADFCADFARFSLCFRKSDCAQINTSVELTELYRVYGIDSADDIQSITEMGNSNNREIGKPVTDRQEIAEFYDMTVALWSYGNDDFQKQMFGGYPDEETQMQAHTAFADDRRNLRIETTDGLRFFISFHPSFD